MNNQLRVCLAILLGTASLCSAAPNVYRDHIEPHWYSNNTKFWYRNSLPNGATEFIVVDAEKGTRQSAFDHAHMAASLSKITGTAIKEDHLPIEALDFESDPNAVLLLGKRDGWRMDLTTLFVTSYAATYPKQLLPAGDRPRRSRGGVKETSIGFENRTEGVVRIFWIDPQGERHSYAELQPGDDWEAQTFAGHVWIAVGSSGKTLGVFEAIEHHAVAQIDGKVVATLRETHAVPRGPGSPDGNWIAFVKNDNLFLRSLHVGAEFQLSQDGKPGDGYALDQLWWSPDSRHLAALRIEAGQEHKVYTVESSPKDQVQPRLRTLDYLKPGDKIAHPRPRLFDIAAHKLIAVSEELFPNPWSITEMRWAADSSRFTLVYNQRGHQVLRLVSVQANDGLTRAIVDEHSRTFIDYSGKYYCHWTSDDELIWMSERDGWNHLWLYDAKSAKAKNVVTAGDYVVQDVTRVDDSKRQIWFRAGGLRPGQDPYCTHLCRVNFDGAGLIDLTDADGTHTVQWSPDEKYLIDTFSRVDQPPIHEVRRGDTGARVCKLEEADAGEVLAARGRHWPERFVAKGRDGVTNIYGIILLPRDFDPNRKYPVVENIYAGPQDFFTPKSFKTRYGTQQQLADRGMIVVQCDGMGTSGRSKEFHDWCWKNLRDGGFPDRIAWIKAAAIAHPQMDLDRVGIYGGSAGGQNAMAAMLWHHDFYKVAVADCGCHDNRMDKIWWNEQWMGWPIGKEYAENSNAVNAGLLGGKLLLIVGELDDNVDPASTMQVVNALEKADKDFDLVIVAGAHHGAAETPYGSRRRMDFLTRNLLESGRK